MKHNNLAKAFLGCLALVGVLSGCQRDWLETNPDYNAETNEVITQFVLNVSAAPQTKMSAQAVQLAQNFRGIDSAKIFTFKTGITGALPYVLADTTKPDKVIDLGLFLPSNGLDNSMSVENNDTTYANNQESSRRVLQLSIPVGTDAVMFYGKAIKASGANAGEFGATTVTYDANCSPAGTVFSAKKILGTTTIVNQYDATARLMIAVINDILERKVEDGGSVTVGTGEDAKVFDNLPEVSWAQLGHQYELDHFPSSSRYANSEENITNKVILGRKLEGLEEVLGMCYYLFTYITPSDINQTPGSAEWTAALEGNPKPTRPLGEYRAGSSFAVKSMIIDMYKVITAASSSTPGNPKEANAKRLAKVILDRAALFFDTDDGEYKDVSDIKELVVNQYHIISLAEWNEKYEGAQDLKGYPFEDFGVPEGAAQLGFHVYGTPTDTTGTYTRDEFYYYHPNKPLVNPTMHEFEPRKYLYPAELWYYGNSPIRITEADVTINSYPNGVTPWSTGAWTGWQAPGAKVTSGTRGVAVVDNINYGVALLKSSVVFAPGVTILQDNRKKLSEGKEENKTINVSSAQLQLRGILIGGVNPRMNWQFTRKYTSTGNHEQLGDLSLFDGVIYDHALSSTAVPNAASPNYTLVYDNYNSSGGQSEAANQNDVYVSLEFVNGGEAFWGRDNLIPSGGVFYLVAKMPKPTADQITALSSKWPTDHQIPPVWGVNGETVTSPAVKGQSKQVARVFIQDFVTTATFTIGATSLQNAYYSVPDLRASQMSLGLSVDLQWTQGLDYVLPL